MTEIENQIKRMEDSRCNYTTTLGVNVLFQRLSKDFMWYAVSNDQIIGCGLDINELKERLEYILPNTDNVEYERYEYITKKRNVVLLQRLIKDSMWYAVSKGQIVKWGRYRHDIEEWCDMAL